MVKFYNVSKSEITAQSVNPITVLKVSANSFTRLATELEIGLDELEEKLFSKERSVEYDNYITITTRSYITLVEVLALYSKYQYATLYNLGGCGWCARIWKGENK